MPSARPTSQLVKSADGISIYADAVGNPANPSIVLLHGLGCGTFIFDAVFENEELLSKFYLVRYDMRGHGRSGKLVAPESHTSELYAADFIAVAAAFELVNPVFIGWSLGSAVIADLVAHPPTDPALRPAGFVSLSGTVTFELRDTIARPALVRVLTSFLTAPGPAARDIFVDALFSPPFPAPAAQLAPSSESSASHDEMSIPAALRDAILAHASLQTPALTMAVGTRTNALPAAPCATPLLILHGAEDKMMDGERLTAAIRSSGKFTNVAVCIIDGGHTLWLENEPAWTSAVQAFMRRVAVKRQRVVSS